MVRLEENLKVDQEEEGGGVMSRERETGILQMAILVEMTIFIKTVKFHATDRDSIAATNTPTMKI